VQDAGNPAQDAEADVDEEVCRAAALHEDGHRRQEEGEEVKEDVGLFSIACYKMN
jgi:hypothetical protein